MYALVLGTVCMHLHVCCVCMCTLPVCGVLCKYTYAAYMHALFYVLQGENIMNFACQVLEGNGELSCCQRYIVKKVEDQLFPVCVSRSLQQRVDEAGEGQPVETQSFELETAAETLFYTAIN